VVSVLAERAYDFVRRRRGAGEDEPGEFLLFMYPRFERMIDRYVDAGVPFEHYLNSVLAWNLRSCRRRARAAERSWQAGRLSELWPGEGRDSTARPYARPEADAGADGPPSPLPVVPPLRTAAARRRFLLLVLRACTRIGPGHLARAAGAARVPAAWLAETVDRLRGAVAPRLARLERLRARRDAAWARMRLLQERRALAVEPGERERLERAIARQAAGWRRACDLIRRVPLEPTHRRLARELGLPRGTVDSALRAALRPGSGLGQEEAIRYA
jgi:hypothetical protein